MLLIFFILDIWREMIKDEKYQDLLQRLVAHFCFSNSNDQSNLEKTF
jgi:hypothetical protein